MQHSVQKRHRSALAINQVAGKESHRKEENSVRIHRCVCIAYRGEFSIFHPAEHNWR